MNEEERVAVTASVPQSLSPARGRLRVPLELQSPVELPSRLTARGTLAGADFEQEIDLARAQASSDAFVYRSSIECRAPKAWKTLFTTPAFELAELENPDDHPELGLEPCSSAVISRAQKALTLALGIALAIPLVSPAYALSSHKTFSGLGGFAGPIAGVLGVSAFVPTARKWLFSGALWRVALVLGLSYVAGALAISRLVAAHWIFDGQRGAWALVSPSNEVENVEPLKSPPMSPDPKEKLPWMLAQFVPRDYFLKKDVAVGPAACDLFKKAQKNQLLLDAPPRECGAGVEDCCFAPLQANGNAVKLRKWGVLTVHEKRVFPPESVASIRLPKDFSMTGARCGKRWELSNAQAANGEYHVPYCEEPIVVKRPGTGTVDVKCPPKTKSALAIIRVDADKVRLARLDEDSPVADHFACVPGGAYPLVYRVALTPDSDPRAGAQFTLAGVPLDRVVVEQDGKEVGVVGCGGQKDVAIRFVLAGKHDLEGKHWITYHVERTGDERDDKTADATSTQLVSKGFWQCGTASKVDVDNAQATIIDNALSFPKKRPPPFRCCFAQHSGQRIRCPRRPEATCSRFTTQAHSSCHETWNCPP